MDISQDELVRYLEIDNSTNHIFFNNIDTNILKLAYFLTNDFVLLKLGLLSIFLKIIEALLDKGVFKEEEEEFPIYITIEFISP